MSDQSQIIGNTVLNVAKHLEQKVDDELYKLDNLSDKDLAEIRKKRAEEVKRLSEQKQKWLTAGHGDYSEIEEKEFFKLAKNSERVICHFYRENWPCKIHAEKAPFLTERLKVWMLPTLALIRNGKADGYVVGFEELGKTDSFSTATLENCLAMKEIIFNESVQRCPVEESAGNSSVKKSAIYKKSASDEESDFDD